MDLFGFLFANYGGRNEKWLPIMIEAIKEKPTLFGTDEIVTHQG